MNRKLLSLLFTVLLMIICFIIFHNKPSKDTSHHSVSFGDAYLYHHKYDPIEITNDNLKSLLNDYNLYFIVTAVEVKGEDVKSNLDIELKDVNLEYVDKNEYSEDMIMIYFEDHVEINKNRQYHYFMIKQNKTYDFNIPKKIDIHINDDTYTKNIDMIMEI